MSFFSFYLFWHCVVVVFYVMRCDVDVNVVFALGGVGVRGGKEAGQEAKMRFLVLYAY